ncbi:MAG: hypothetical protein AAGF12_42775 [Myxococcota bacterium]
MLRRVQLVALAVAMGGYGCGDDGRTSSPDAAVIPDGSTTDTGMGDADAAPIRSGLLSDAPLSFPQVYAAVTAQAQGSTETRPWIPTDLDMGTDGALWVIQRMNRLPQFTDATECTMRSNTPGVEDDCFGIQGSTVTITDPQLAEPATEANGRARLIVDGNSWHFMRRPAGIAFGLAETTIPIGDPGTLSRDGTPLVQDTMTYAHVFATCHEHETANFTDDLPFIGPSLWTGDFSVYNGEAPFAWSNGSHLDMVHATQHCMGIAWERDNIYWLINGMEGTLDRYDFRVAHLPGHFYHEDAEIKRWLWDADRIARVQDVPSGLEIAGTQLLIADTGNGRILSVDISNEPPEQGNFRSFENLPATIHRNPTTLEFADNGTLSALWGGTPQPSGLTVFNDEAVIVADYATGNISIFELEGGAEIRTVDTGLGAGIGGLAVMNGTVYFTHMETRGVYRIDVQN